MIIPAIDIYKGKVVRLNQENLMKYPIMIAILEI